MHPVLFEVAGFPVGTYALAVLLGLAAGCAVFAWLGGRAGHDRWALVELTLWSFVIGILAAKLFALAWPSAPGEPRPSLLETLRYGGHFYPGLLAGIVWLLLGLRRHGIPVLRGLDYMMPAVAIGHALGRTGCLFAGCCWGRACSADLPWAITFTDEAAGRLTGVPLGVAMHPTQAYEALALLVIFGILVVQHLRWPAFPGSTFLVYVALYGVTRAILESFRDDPRGTLFGLPTSQPLAVLSVALAIVAWPILARRHVRAGEAAAAAPPPPAASLT